jgi:hypothetical protein
LRQAYFIEFIAVDPDIHKSARRNPIRRVASSQETALMIDEEDTYQVWQANDASAAAAGWSAFPADYRRAIEVIADNVSDAFEATNHDNWWEANEVNVVASNVRSTAVGDVIIDLDGIAHRIMADGFKEIDPSTERPVKDEPPLERVERQLIDGKKRNSPAYRPDPAAGRIGPGTYTPEEDVWSMLQEAGKLHVLEVDIDWNGVEGSDKEAILAREVDFSKVSRAHLNQVYEDVGAEFDIETDERPARRLFDKANFERAALMPGDFVEQLAATRDTTRNLVEAVMADSWPRAAAVVDFGLDSQEHYESLYYPIRNQEIMPAVLDAAMGYGEKLTEITRDSPSNPHKTIDFHTSWDELLGRPAGEQRQDRAPSSDRWPSDQEAAHALFVGMDEPDR